MPGTCREASRCSHPRMPVPMEAKRTVSLGATGRVEAYSVRGCRTDLATPVATRAPEPICINWRRDRGFLDIGLFASQNAEVISGQASADRGNAYGDKLLHSGREIAKTIF